MREGQCGAQQVANSVKVVLVLLDGFNPHPFSGQQSLIARGIAGRRHEFEVSMTTAEQEASPEVMKKQSKSSFEAVCGTLFSITSTTRQQRKRNEKTLA